ncbi:exo-alpha-sialidase [Cyclobacterium xiamenense]|uniref:exo-alpha-sialidase n=1 Tax=Cyclobacterium xiamenense TaxID=1297121 RepID=UPI001F50A137|nr:exo-alpha-sialidase [Cyclobacterium xiamenense]
MKPYLRVHCLLVFVGLFGFLTSSSAQTGSIHEPVRYIGGTSIDPDVHEGRLRYAVGVESRQTLRVNRSQPELADGFGWTYSHASNLAYWEGTFFQQYLSNPVDEHISPGQTLLIRSEDGRNWSEPVVLFPPYPAPEGVQIPEGYAGYMMHQRMGFYVSNSGKLLSLAFYGHSEDPFEAGGIGRVVREIKKDGSFGPIYFIRYSSHTDWNESNTAFPLYTTSPDTAFIHACEELLENTLITLQWRDEDNGLDGFYTGERGGSAFSYYTRKDGKTIGFWKRSLVAISEDAGKTFSPSVKVPTLTMAGDKVWAQQTPDNRYALVYNPIDIDEYRYPLIAISSDDGILFDDMVLVQGEVPPRRFYGRWKDFGPCYVRGIVQGNGTPPGNDMWLTYSMNKEDMWVSRVPTPIRHVVKGAVDDDFDELSAHGPIPDWNIYSPRWAPVQVVPSPSGEGMVLELADEDPYDYARAIRIFEEGQEVSVEWEFMASAGENGRLEMDLTDRYGNRPVRITLDESRNLSYWSGHERKVVGKVETGNWQRLRLRVLATPGGHFSLAWNGEQIAEHIPLTVAVKSIERLSFRTGPYRDLPGRKTPNEDPVPPLPGADKKVPRARFFIDQVSVHP